MTIAMDSDFMPASVDSLYEILIAFNIFPDQKECRVNVMLRQHIQHARRIARVRTVIECQGDLVAGWVAAPQDVGVAGLHP